jgi:acyl-CoA synthetase (AMP-forming)/AMP-acid ligase II
MRDRVVMWSASNIDAVPLFAGLAKMGAVFAPANALLGLNEAAEMIGLDISLLVLGEIGDDTTPDDDAPGLTEDDLHVLFFTSGSTGKSKGVMLTHRVNFLRTHAGPSSSRAGPRYACTPCSTWAHGPSACRRSRPRRPSWSSYRPTPH